MPSIAYQPLPSDIREAFSPMAGRYPRALRRLQRKFATGDITHEGLVDLAMDLNNLSERSATRFMQVLDSADSDDESDRESNGGPGGLFRGSSGEGIDCRGYEARIRALEMLQARARFPGKNQNLSVNTTWTVGTSISFAFDDIGLEFGFMPLCTYESNVGGSESKKITSIVIDNATLSLTGGIGRSRYVIDNVNAPIWAPFVYVGKANKITVIQDVIAASAGTAEALLELVPLDKETRDAVLAALGEY